MKISACRPVRWEISLDREPRWGFRLPLSSGSGLASGPPAQSQFDLVEARGKRNAVERDEDSVRRRDEQDGGSLSPGVSIAAPSYSD